MVKDGALGPDLEYILSEAASMIPIHFVALRENVGLGRALNIGLREATQPWIMRFDTDDISVPQRVLEQVRLAETGSVDLFGSQILEFGVPPVVLRQRVVPTGHDAIARMITARNPFNHMTVCFRKALVEEVGGYPPYRRMQDYMLWIRLLQIGARTANDSRALVLARAGNALWSRRSGLSYIRAEAALQRDMVRLGLKPAAAAVSTGLARSAVFAMPAFARRAVYKYLLRARPSPGVHVDPR